VAYNVLGWLSIIENNIRASETHDSSAINLRERRSLYKDHYILDIVLAEVCPRRIWPAIAGCSI